jgi:hypothetical protein
VLKLSTEDRAAFADRIRADLADHGRALVLYEPGDMTHYEFGIVRAGSLSAVAAAAGDQDCRRNASPKDWVMFDPDHRRSSYAPIVVGLDVHPSWVREHWTDNEWEAAVVAELLTLINGGDAGPLRAAHPHIFGT